MVCGEGMGSGAAVKISKTAATTKKKTLLRRKDTIKVRMAPSVCVMLTAWRSTVDDTPTSAPVIGDQLVAWFAAAASHV